jgi:glycosyltransferase involved in cell wall biosynthesis
MIEAMASGVPALGARGSSLTEVVGDGGLLFDPYDKEDLVKKVELVLGDGAIRSQLVERGYQQVKKFSYARCAQETLEVYRRAVG